MPSLAETSKDNQLNSEWIEPISNWPECESLIKAYNNGVELPVIYNYLKDQNLYILTEWGVRHPIALQKPYFFQLTKTDSGFHVLDQNRVELGERSGRYLSFDALGEAPNQGLINTYEVLLDPESKQDKAVVIYSRSELYKQFNSQNDVLLVFSKTDQNNLFQGQYIFLDKMSDQEVQFILERLIQNYQINTDANHLVSSPFVINHQNLLELLEDIAVRFENKFHHSIYDNTVKTPDLVQKLEALAGANVDRLFSAMLFGNKDNYNQILLDKIKDSLKVYAQDQGMSIKQVNNFILAIQAGQIQLTGGEFSLTNIQNPWDSYNPLFSWYQFKVCDVCGRTFYGSGEICGSCDIISYNN